jgi:hypoxia up-regulated 1
MKLLFVFFISLLQFVSSTVIGIDFGNEYFKVALISAGKSLVIIENTTTKRKTQNAIAFHIKER